MSSLFASPGDSICKTDSELDDSRHLQCKYIGSSPSPILLMVSRSLCCCRSLLTHLSGFCPSPSAPHSLPAPTSLFSCNIQMILLRHKSDHLISLLSPHPRLFSSLKVTVSHTTGPGHFSYFFDLFCSIFTNFLHSTHGASLLCSNTPGTSSGLCTWQFTLCGIFFSQRFLWASLPLPQSLLKRLLVGEIFPHQHLLP